MTRPIAPRARALALKKFLLWAGGILVVLLVAAYILVPVIASSVAPGLIESRVAASMKGTVKVGSVSVSWGGPTEVKDVELFDPSGGRVAKISATSSMGIWSVLSGMKDLGSLEVAGQVDLVARPTPDGRMVSNLQSAAEPRTPSAPSASSSGGSLPKIAVSLKANGLTVTYKELDAKGAVFNEAAIKDARGSIVLSAAGAGAASANADLAAGFVEGAGAAAGLGAPTGDMKIKAVITNLADASGTLTLDAATIDATVTATRVPMRLVDALAQQSGVLLDAVGDKADLTLTAKGTTKQADLDLKLTAPNATADAAVAVADNRLTARRPIALDLKNSDFLQRVPAVHMALNRAGMTLDAYPDLHAAIDRLNLPIGGAGDLRGASVSAKITTGGVRGRMVPQDQPGTAARAFAWTPLSLTLESADIAQGVTLTGATSATIDGQSAGDLRLDVAASGLLDDRGALKPGTPGALRAVVEARAVSTQLVQPIFSALGDKVDLVQDVGPTADLRLTVATREGAPVAAGASPLLDAELSMNSRNIRAAGALRVDDAIIASDEITVNIASAGPLFTRLMGGSMGGAGVPSGAGQVDVRISELRLPRKDGAIDAAQVRALVSADVRDLSVGIPAGNGQPITSARIVQVSTANLAMDLRTGGSGSPKVTLRADAAHEGRPFTVNGEITPVGLGDPPALGSGRAALGGLGTLRLTGQITADAVPGSLVQALGGSSDDVNALLAEMIGPSVNVTAGLSADDPGAQGFSLSAQGSNLQASAQGALKSVALDLTAASLRSTIRPEAARTLERVFGQEGQIGGASLASTTTITASVDPVSIPLKAGTTEPDFASAGSATLKARLGIDQPLVVQGLRAGENTITGGVGVLNASAELPVASLGGGGGGSVGGGGAMKINATGTLIRAVGEPPVATLTADLARAQGAGLNGTIKLDNVDTVRADDMLGQQGKVSGAVGPTARITVDVAQPAAAAPMTITANIEAQRLTASGIRFVQDEQAVRLQGPMTVSWTIEPQWASRYLLSSAEGRAAADILFAGAGMQPGGGGGGGVSLTEPAVVNMTVNQMAFGQTRYDSAGNPTSGPLAPGVFALDAKVSIARLAVTRREMDQATGRTVETHSLFENLALTAQGAGTGLSYTLTADKVQDGTSALPEPLRITGAVRDLADARGVMLPGGGAVDLWVRDVRVPTTLIDNFAGRNGKMVETLGESVVVNVSAVNVSRITAGGSFDASLVSPNGSLSLAGPVRSGVLDTGDPSAGKPVRAELKEFHYTSKTQILQIFPLFAKADRQPGDRPSIISTRALTIPVDGDMTKLNGMIDVDIGRIDFTFAEAFGPIMDAMVGANAQQTAMRPFTITVQRGVLTYRGVEVPVKDLPIRMSGTIDLVRNEMDVTTEIPILLLGTNFAGSIVPGFPSQISEATKPALKNVTVPFRTKGPLSSPSTAVPEESKGPLQNVLGGVGGLLNVIPGLGGSGGGGGLLPNIPGIPGLPGSDKPKPSSGPQPIQPPSSTGSSPVAPYSTGSTGPQPIQPPMTPTGATGTTGPKPIPPASTGSSPQPGPAPATGTPKPAATGKTGSTGPKPIPAATGSTGSTGATGQTGATGVTGATGSTAPAPKPKPKPK